MSVKISTDLAQNPASTRPRRHFLCVALCVAAFANALVPTVFFSATRLFGHIDPRYRALVAVVVMIEYAIAFLLLLLHANEAFASGYALATAAIVTLGSAGIAFLIVEPAGWGWDASTQKFSFSEDSHSPSWPKPFFSSPVSARHVPSTRDYTSAASSSDYRLPRSLGSVQPHSSVKATRISVLRSPI